MSQPKFVVGVDGSQPSVEALRWAGEEAQVRGGLVRVVHAWQTPLRLPAPRQVDDDVEVAETMAKQTLKGTIEAAAIGDDVAFETALTRGDPVPCLLREAEGAALVAVGSRGRGGFTGLLLGSVSQQVVHHAHCSVAVIGRQEVEPEPSIVVGVDGSPNARSAVQWAADEARLRHAALRVVCAWRPPLTARYPRYGSNLSIGLMRHEAMEALDETIHGIVDDNLTASIEVTRTVVAEAPALALLEMAKNAAMLVVGARGRGGFAGLFLGSVSETCVHHAPCPLVIVR